MNERDDTEVAQETASDSRIQAVRTYGEIAAILREREGAAISALHVMRTCRAVERSVARALLDDPAFLDLFDT